MNKIELIEKSKSVREYKNKPLSREDRLLLESILERPLTKGEVGLFELHFEEDGASAASRLSGLAGYSGRMIEAPHYLVLLSEPTGEGYRQSGFIGQDVIFQLMQEGIGSCWISVEDHEGVKQNLGLSSDKRVVALIALGYPKQDGFFEKLFAGIRPSKSIHSGTGYADLSYKGKEDLLSSPSSSLVYVGEWGNTADADELERRGFLGVYHYMKYAPSWGNRRPWKFILQGEDVLMAVEKTGQDALTDHLEGGIAMYYFRLAMHEMGFGGEWSPQVQADIPENYLLVGKYSLN